MTRAETSPTAGTLSTDYLRRVAFTVPNKRRQASLVELSWASTAVVGPSEQLLSAALPQYARAALPLLF